MSKMELTHKSVNDISEIVEDFCSDKTCPECKYEPYSKYCCSIPIVIEKVMKQKIDIDTIDKIEDSHKKLCLSKDQCTDCKYSEFRYSNCLAAFMIDNVINNKEV